VTVLSKIDLKLYPGEVHGVIGENGAGKSTFAKILAGVRQPDAGTLYLRGQKVTVPNPLAATRMGIALIHQEPLTFGDLTVAENIFVGHQPVELGLVQWKTMTQQAGEILTSLGPNISPQARVRGLSVADQQMVEMAASLSHQAELLILDETTAALTPTEVQRLFKIVRHLRDQGKSIVFISHRMDEIFELCDRITVLRDGEKVAESKTHDTTIDLLLRQMVGRNVDIHFERKPNHKPGRPALEINHLSGAGFENITFTVREGEIVGMAGLVGAGRTEIAHALFGATRFKSGNAKLFGENICFHSPTAALRHGLAYVTEDRQHHGILMPLSVSRNGALGILSQLSKFGWLSNRDEKRAIQPFVDHFNIVLRGLDQPIRQLSGGNQQKVVLSRALLARPRVLILDEPTRGIDVGAKVEVHRLISQFAADGLAILMISSDLPEILAMSDRVLVMREGRLQQEFTRQQATSEMVIAAATGQDHNLPGASPSR
jgi:rhamnose transport system ATP-binding protein